MTTEDRMLDELKQIKEHLAAKPAPPPPAPKGMWAEFKAFIENYKVMGLAVAFIMGVYLGNLVQSLVKDLLLPVVGIALADVYLASLTVEFAGQSFGVGNFLVALITFIIVAFVIFILVKLTKKWGIK